MNETARKSDNDQAYFGPLQIPKKWRTLLFFIAGIGTFLGSFFVTLKKMTDDEPKQSAFVMDKMEEINSRINDIGEMISSLSGRQTSLEKQSRDIKKAIQALDKGEDPYSPEEQLNEILEKLRDFEKRGIKKR